jgi:hypothetical protein
MSAAMRIAVDVTNGHVIPKGKYSLLESELDPNFSYMQKFALSRIEPDVFAPVGYDDEGLTPRAPSPRSHSRIHS